MRCDGCGSENHNNSEFCFKCGKSLKQGYPQGYTQQYYVSGQGAAPASFLGGLPVQSNPGTAPQSGQMPQQNFQGLPPTGYTQSYPGNYGQMPPPQTAGLSQSFPGQYAQMPPPQTIGMSQSFPGQTQGYSPVTQMNYTQQFAPGRQQTVNPGAYPPGTIVTTPRSGPAQGRRGHQMTPEEKLIRAKHEARIRERYQNPGIAWFSLIFGIIAVLFVGLRYANPLIHYFHYVGLGIGVFACICAIFEKRRNNRLAEAGFAFGAIAILFALIVIIIIYGLNLVI